jgi:hypothetical protein
VRFCISHGELLILPADRVGMRKIGKDRDFDLRSDVNTLARSSRAIGGLEMTELQLASGFDISRT